VMNVDEVIRSVQARRAEFNRTCEDAVGGGHGGGCGRG
jgi:hypothetical protein